MIIEIQDLKTLFVSLAQESDLDVQKSSPCHLFVNSEYWGVYNIREKNK